MTDLRIRSAAFAEINRRVQICGSSLPWEEIIRTFRIGEEEIFITNRARGIFKPKQMQRGILSVKSTSPRTGRTRRYVDDRLGETLFYSLQGDDPLGHDNRRLKEAFDDQTPFIYFFGVSAARYEVLWPAYVLRWLPNELKIEIRVTDNIVDDSASSVVREDTRRYGARQVQQRLHQAAFREMVLDAYDGRCSLTGFPVRALLHAAHIYPDGHQNGFAAVTNGIALSALHHLAYDGKLIGIDPDGRVEVSERILSQKDGPMLEDGLKALHKQLMRFPRDSDLRPDKDALAFRFEEFRAAI
jgi:putative restriction endonuclease